MGQAILDAIKSGLGLIKDLASEFLDGFTTLFWVPASTSGSETVAAHLTEFGTFALVMVGISVSFACITTIVSLVRSNTGI